MKLFRVWEYCKNIADIEAESLQEASEIAGKAYPNQTIRVEQA